jgi:hypothetical protein
MLLFGFLTQYCAGYKIDKDEMGGACNSNGRVKRSVQGFGEET